jgi:hypothetical protein
MVQEIIIALIFIGAVAYLIRLFLKRQDKDAGCSNGCSACSTVDFEAIEGKFKEKNKENDLKRDKD